MGVGAAAERARGPAEDGDVDVGVGAVAERAGGLEEDGDVGVGVGAAAEVEAVWTLCQT